MHGIGRVHEALMHGHGTTIFWGVRYCLGALHGMNMHWIHIHGAHMLSADETFCIALMTLFLISGRG